VHLGDVPASARAARRRINLRFERICPASFAASCRFSATLPFPYMSAARATQPIAASSRARRMAYSFNPYHSWTTTMPGRFPSPEGG